jgi:hypothetical protein
MAKMLWSDCRCGKRTYETRRMAKAAIKEIKKRGRDIRPEVAMHVYPACGGEGWHIGHCGRLHIEQAPGQ